MDIFEGTCLKAVSHVNKDRDLNAKMALLVLNRVTGGNGRTIQTKNFTNPSVTSYSGILPLETNLSSSTDTLFLKHIDVQDRNHVWEV